MAPTRPLIMQHRSSFTRILKLRGKDTEILTGKTPPGHRGHFWSGTARVVFSTPQVVRNDLMAGGLSLEDNCLLVFDECHRAVKNYAYTDVARFYASQAKYPLMLGMTASPGSNLDRILEVCRNLYIERVEYRTEMDRDVKPYIHPIEVEWKRVNLPDEYLKIEAVIQSMLSKRVNWLCRRGIIQRNPKYVTKTTLIKAGDDLRYLLETSIEEERGQVFVAIINQSLAVTLFHMLELLETQGLYTLKAFLDKVDREKQEKRSYSILVNNPQYKQLRTLVDSCSTKHPKIDLLRQNVKNQLRKKPSSRMLVFTQYRDTATHLVEELSEIPGVSAERVVGQASKVNDKGLSQEEQAERIRMLQEGELNVLVATSIAEEGLDIPAVDHVIFYEPIPSEIRYIQRRGRTGRKAPGKVMILAANDTLDMIYLYASGRRTERMRRIAENVNSKLQIIIRKRAKPPINPLTPAELKLLEEKAVKVKEESETAKTELETLKEFKKKVERTRRNLYMKLLETGISGVTLDQLASEFEVTSPQIVKAALGSMMKEGWVTEPVRGRYAATSAVKSAGMKTYEILVEKIYHGSVVVRVDDKWRARLDHQEYSGPRNLIKKNARFRAAAKLYRLEGTLCISVNEVTEILD